MQYTPKAIKQRHGGKTMFDATIAVADDMIRDLGIETTDAQVHGALAGMAEALALAAAADASVNFDPDDVL